MKWGRLKLYLDEQFGVPRESEYLGASESAGAFESFVHGAGVNERLFSQA